MFGIADTHSTMCAFSVGIHAILRSDPAPNRFMDVVCFVSLFPQFAGQTFLPIRVSFVARELRTLWKAYFGPMTEQR